MVNLLEANDLLFIQDLNRVVPQVSSTLSYQSECQLPDSPDAMGNYNITEMDATEATRAEGSVDNEVLDGIRGFGPFLER